MLNRHPLIAALKKGTITASTLCLTSVLALGSVPPSMHRAERLTKTSDESVAASRFEQTNRPATARRTVFEKQGEPFVVSTAQTETAQQTPAQRDAQRPPGTEQQQSVPPQARPNQVDPTAPPGTERPSPQTPPGTQLPPPNTPSTTGAPRPTTEPTPATTQPATGTELPEIGSGQEISEPRFPPSQPRPVPPLPSLARIGVTSGDTLALSLNDAIRRALENNNEIEVARNDVRLAESQLLSLRGIYDPVFQFTPQINNSVRPVVNIFGGANQSGTVTTTDFSNNVAIARQFGTGGGNYSYFFNNTRETTTASNTTLNPFYSANQGLSFTQPLLRNRSIDRNRQQIRVQRKRLEQSDADFRRRTIEIISQVQRAYWDLVFALRDEQNQIANLNLARENFRRTEASVAAGRVAPLERAEVQTELSNREAALLVSSQTVTIAENALKSLIIKDPLAPEWSRAFVPTDSPAFDDKPVNLEAALTEARQNRPELRRLKLQDEISAIDIQYFKNQTRPRIDLTGTVSTTGLAGTPSLTTGATGVQVPLISGDPNTNASAFLLAQINQQRALAGLPPVAVPLVTPQAGAVPQQFSGSYGQTLRNLFSFDTRNVVVGVTIEVPFRNRTAQANLASARIQRDQLAAQTRSTEQLVVVEVRNAAQAVETNRRRVLAAREARQNAELQLAGERRLYEVGRSTTYLLFQRENQLVNARNQELRAETDYNKALADLQRASSTTLNANNVMIDSPVAPEKFKD